MKRKWKVAVLAVIWLMWLIGMALFVFCVETNDPYTSFVAACAVISTVMTAHNTVLICVCPTTT